MQEDLPERLAAGVTAVVRFNHADMDAKLRPPLLGFLSTGSRELNLQTIRLPGGQHRIAVGGGVYSYFLQYTRAAAAYFLASEPGGAKPSENWPEARAALATTLEWIATPAATLRFPKGKLTARQTATGEDFAAYTLRFGVCHEMAHVVLEHLDGGATGTRRVGNQDLEALQASQEMEWDADGLGLKMHVLSAGPINSAIAFATAIYFIHAAWLMDARLMLLAKLVDERKWKIQYTHPHAVARIFKLLGAAQAFPNGQGTGLEKVHEDLVKIQGEVWDTANRQQEDAAAKTIAAVRKSAAGEDSTVMAQELAAHFDRSPLGVIQGLAEAANEAPAHAAAAEEFVAALPQEFQEFWRQSPAERAAALA